MITRTRRWALSVPVALILSVRPLVAQADVSAKPPDTADVSFMQGMIEHHAQALAMVSLIPTHSTRADLQAIGLRIKISQQDEIAFMQRWLRNHHQVVPTLDSANVAHMPDEGMSAMGMGGTPMMLMPGMMTPTQMTQLAHANGPEFDRLFLEGMIRHHQGALTMVKNLLATTGAAQAPEVFTFASDADADQRAEIKRMQSVLDAMAVAHPTGDTHQ
jgi:uncharacterized protein (DUF305 family)